MALVIASPRFVDYLIYMYMSYIYIYYYIYIYICNIYIIIYIYLYLVGGIPTPLKNDGVRQLG